MATINFELESLTVKCRPIIKKDYKPNIASAWDNVEIIQFHIYNCYSSKLITKIMLKRRMKCIYI